MARPMTGIEHLEAAKAARNRARTARELLGALAVLLPLEHNLSLEQTAQLLGQTRGAVSRLRNGLLHDLRHPDAPPKRTRKDLRNRAKTTLEEESRILDEVLHHAAEGGMVVVPRIKPMIEHQLGKRISLATAYNMLHRHGWRKIAPDTRHPKGDEQVQHAWKKNCG